MPRGLCVGLLAVLLLLPLQALAAASPESQTASVSGVQVAQLSTAVDEDFDDPFAEEELIISDPIEPFNRAMFWVNDNLYFYLFKPIARGYRVVPEPARVSVANFFSNLGTPVRLVNAMLQFKLDDSGREAGRFVVNSTVGLLGLFDPAKNWLGWDKKDEDFGQNLGVYGAGPRLYLVLTVFGP